LRCAGTRHNPGAQMIGGVPWQDLHVGGFQINANPF